MIFCSAGYICDKNTLGAPNTLCPKGSVCLENVGTANYTVSEKSNYTAVKNCTKGCYCLASTKTTT